MVRFDSRRTTVPKVFVLHDVSIDASTMSIGLARERAWQAFARTLERGTTYRQLFMLTVQSCYTVL